MTFPEIYQQFIQDIQQTTLLEYIAVISGIVSVWYSRKESILTYPTGLVNTIVYVYISFKGGLLGEASVNFYYTVMSLYGWWLWSRRDRLNIPVLHLAFSTARWWIWQLLFFGLFYLVIFLLLTELKKDFAPNAIPWADALASASAFTGMWLMTKKKVESWYWWLVTNCASIPLYFVKHYVFTSVYYVVLFIMAVFGLLEWTRRARQNKKPGH